MPLPLRVASRVVTTSEPAAAPAEGEGKPDASAKKGIFAKAGDYLAARGELLKKISGHEGEIARLRGELETANKTVATQATELKELRDGKAALEQSVARLEKEQKTTAEAAADIVAGQGVPAGNLPPVSDESQDVAASDAEHLGKYAGLKGSAKTAYYRANKAAITRAAKAQKKK